MCRLLPTLYLLAVLSTPAVAAPADEQQFLDAVRGFYTWVLPNGKQTEALQPHTAPVAGSTRIYLDMSTLDAFVSRFLSSTYFAPEFHNAVQRYYMLNKQEIESWTQEEYDALTRDGGGPLLDTEDMDIFFCAQEYEYTEDFVKGMKIKSYSVTRNRATAVVVSPYQWETKFSFVKVRDRWLISGYCVYQ